MAVVDAGAVDKFIRLLSSSSPNVAEQAVWALGNIAGDGSKTRDIVLNANVVEGLIQLFSSVELTVRKMHDFFCDFLFCVFAYFVSVYKK